MVTSIAHALLMVFIGVAHAESLTLQAPPNFQLVNQNGKPFKLHRLKGKPLLVSFIYSRCPMPRMCPLTMKLTRQLVADLKKMRHAPPIRSLLVTLDPEHDTPKELKALARRHRLDLRHVTLATGEPEVLKELQHSLLVIGIKEGEFVAHNARTVLLDADLKPIADWEDNRWDTRSVLKAYRDKGKVSPPIAAGKR